MKKMNLKVRKEVKRMYDYTESSRRIREEQKEYEQLSLERKLQKLGEFQNMTDRPANDVARNRDEAKGKVRMRWNHKQSVNVSKYRIDRVAERSLKVYEVDPDPVTLTRDELWRKL